MTQAGLTPTSPFLPEVGVTGKCHYASLAARPRLPGRQSLLGPIICSLWNRADNAASEALMSPMVPAGKEFPAIPACHTVPAATTQHLRHLLVICGLLSMRTTSQVCYVVFPLNIAYENPDVPLIMGRGEEGNLSCVRLAALVCLHRETPPICCRHSWCGNAPLPLTTVENPWPFPLPFILQKLSFKH